MSEFKKRKLKEKDQNIPPNGKFSLKIASAEPDISPSHTPHRTSNCVVGIGLLLYTVGFKSPRQKKRKNFPVISQNFQKCDLLQNVRILKTKCKKKTNIFLQMVSFPSKLQVLILFLLLQAGYEFACIAQQNTPHYGTIATQISTCVAIYAMLWQ